MMYHFQPLAPADVSARALVLSLLSSTGAKTDTSIARLVHAAALFGIEAPTLRVAVTRLLKDGLVESPDRGVYRPGPKARGLTRRVQDWQNVRARLAPWKGDWLVALTHDLGRTDRKQVRARERALALSGYREAGAALWVRPANLARALDDHRADLIDIGADEAISLLNVTATAMPAAPGWPDLWSASDLAASYAAAMHAMRGKPRPSASARRRRSSTRNPAHRPGRHPPDQLRSAPAARARRPARLSRNGRRHARL
jgi:phenylacetic acid degradation operon negative regulatory protein